ncbi:MAG: phosphoserine phosphatase SerB [Bdellovibrionales bacterium]|nr:phosphoserine phosphatase SerB [Bdellovibrionales bacterium]
MNQSPSETHLLTWITPVIPQKELEGLYAWVNGRLTEAGFQALSSFTRMKTSFCFEPKEALRLDFEVDHQEGCSIQALQESIWSEIFAASHPAPRPYLVSLRPSIVVRAPKALACFDMDSTLLNEEVIDEIAREAGFFQEVAAITEEAMQGKLDFEASLRRRVKLFYGMPKARAANIIPRLTLSPGGNDLISFLRSNGLKTAVVSGGFEFILKHFQKQLFLDQVFGNLLLVDDQECFTGELEPPIVDAIYKKKLVAQLKNSYGVTQSGTITVGDGANDIPMMEEAGTQVSFCGKPKLSAHCNSLILDRNLLWLKALI